VQLVLATTSLNTTFRLQATLPLAKTSCDVPRPLTCFEHYFVDCSLARLTIRCRMIDLPLGVEICQPDGLSVRSAVMNPRRRSYEISRSSRARLRRARIVRTWSEMVVGGEGDVLWLLESTALRLHLLRCRGETICDFGAWTAYLHSITCDLQRLHYILIIVAKQYPRRHAYTSHILRYRVLLTCTGTTSYALPYRFESRTATKVKIATWIEQESVTASVAPVVLSTSSVQRASAPLVHSHDV
jgi:hypothetical protein